MNILNVGYDSTNYYLLEPDRAGLLVDVGWPGTLPRLLNELKRKGVSFEKIKYLLCTHYHPDHAGLAQDLKEKGVQLIVLDTQVAALASMDRYMKPANHFHKISQDRNLNLSAETSRAFLASIQIRGSIIYTPGHSEDSVILVLDDGLAFTGDALSPMQEAGSQDQVESIRNELHRYGVRIIYPGHGPVQKYG